METVNIIENYYQDVNERNFDQVEKYLHPDVQFIGPLAKLNGKEAVLDATRKFTTLFKTLKIRAKCGSPNQAMVVYDLVCPEPIGVFSTAVLMTFENNLIIKLELFYDARPFDKKKEEVFSSASKNS